MSLPNDRRIHAPPTSPSTPSPSAPAASSFSCPRTPHEVFPFTRSRQKEKRDLSPPPSPPPSPPRLENPPKPPNLQNSQRGQNIKETPIPQKLQKTQSFPKPKNSPNLPEYPKPQKPQKNQKTQNNPNTQNNPKTNYSFKLKKPQKLHILSSSLKNFSSLSRHDNIKLQESAQNHILGIPYIKISEIYELGWQLGEGTTAIVRNCRNFRTGETFACKTLSKRSMCSRSAIDSVRLEVCALQAVKGHPNVVALWDVLEDEEDVHIIMEICDGGDLFDRIKQRKKYSERNTALICSSLLSVLRHCHGKGIMHRDVKPENVMLTSWESDVDIKLVDFGQATFFAPGKDLTKPVGSKYYVAPEVLDCSYGPEADIWSLGVTLYVLLCGRRPFLAKTDMELYRKIREGIIDLEHGQWKNISENAKHLLSRMLCRDPKKRITAEEAQAHSWLHQQNKSGCSTSSLSPPSPHPSSPPLFSSSPSPLSPHGLLPCKSAPTHPSSPSIFRSGPTDFFFPARKISPKTTLDYFGADPHYFPEPSEIVSSSTNFSFEEEFSRVPSFSPTSIEIFNPKNNNNNFQDNVDYSSSSGHSTSFFGIGKNRLPFFNVDVNTNVNSSTDPHSLCLAKCALRTFSSEKIGKKNVGCFSSPSHIRLSICQNFESEKPNSHGCCLFDDKSR